MPDFKNMSLEELLRPEGFDCACGRRHSTGIRYLKIGRGVIEKLPEALGVLGASHPFVVCDENTYRAAGERVTEILKREGIPYSIYIFDGSRPVLPSEREVGLLTMRFDPACDLILGVGSGVINDLCKVLGYATHRPNAIVGTAPSMDGYSSNSSAMELDGMKMTLYNQSPSAILCDTEIMAQAPMRMLRAGFGDMIAKYVSVCEWHTAQIIAGEYYCNDVADMMRAAVQRIMSSVDGICARDPDAIGYVAEGLVLSGLAMAFANVSRPASGIEHRFSHIWEMIHIARGSQLELHGIQVGVGTVLALKLYEYIKELKPDLSRAEAAIAAYDDDAWVGKIRRVFAPAVADEIIRGVRKSRQNEADVRLERARRICGNWEEIRGIICGELPDTATVLEAARKLGSPIRPEEINVTLDETIDALLCSHDIRDKYISTSMLFDLGLLDEAADVLRDALA